MKDRAEPFTLFDRFAVGFGASLIAAVVGSIIWLMLSCRRGCLFWVPYEYVWYAAGFMGVVGFIFGPDRTAALFGAVLGRDRSPGA